MRRPGRHVVAALVAILGIGCQRPPLARSGGIVVEGGYAYPSMGGGASAFVHFHNNGPRPDTMVGVASPMARALMLHSTDSSGGVSRMVHQESITIEGGAEVRMAPGSMHIMVMDLKHAIAPGDSFEVELQFAVAGTISVRLPVVWFGKTPGS